MAELSAGEMVGLFALFFFAIFVYIGVRMFRESRDQKATQEDTRAEIYRRAAGKGRRIEDGTGDLVWTQHGTLPGGEAWTLQYRVAQVERSFERSSGLDRRPEGITIEIGPRTETVRNLIDGQRLVWRCPALKRAQHVFAFHKRTDDKPQPGEVVFGEEERLWWRWRLVTADESLARRAFGPEVNALLARLPLRAARNTHEDERTSIVLGTDGLVFERGVYEFDADQVDLVIAIGEALAAGIASRRP